MTDSTQARQRALDVVEAMAPVVPEGGLSPEQRLIDDLGFDSLRLVELTMALEDALGLAPIPQARLADVMTVGAVQDLAAEMKEPES